MNKIKIFGVGLLTSVGLLISVGLLVCLLCFSKRDNVVILKYEVSQDGSEMSCEVSETTSIGYINAYKDKVEVKEDGDKVHKITFYGGMFKIRGSKNKIKIQLSENDKEIKFNRSDGNWETVLIKDKDTGEWERVVKIGEGLRDRMVGTS